MKAPISYTFFFQLLKSGHHRLVLRDVDLKSSGTYSCQITLSGPPFHTEQRDKNLSVISKYFMDKKPSWRKIEQCYTRLIIPKLNSDECYTLF